MLKAGWMGKIPWVKFFLLWGLAILMGGSLLWLHWGFTSQFVGPFVWMVIAVGTGLLWATSRPQWKKVYCSWCGSRVKAHTSRKDEKGKGWVFLYPCQACGHITEKSMDSLH